MVAHREARILGFERHCVCLAANGRGDWCIFEGKLGGLLIEGGVGRATWEGTKWMPMILVAVWACSGD